MTVIEYESLGKSDARFTISFAIVSVEKRLNDKEPNYGQRKWEKLKKFGGLTIFRMILYSGYFLLFPETVGVLSMMSAHVLDVFAMTEPCLGERIIAQLHPQNRFKDIWH